jgi:phosphomannomutase
LPPISLIRLFDKKYIKFGTSGFRAFVNKDFVQRRSDFVTAAICGDLETSQDKGGRAVVITYDTRIGAREFALESARVFLARGFPVRFAEEPSPTGALVYWLREEEHGEAAGGENMTPSHNPLSTQGQRWNMENGDVAPTSVTDRIEREANIICMRDPEIEKYDLKQAQSEGKFVYINMREKYVAWVADFLRSQKLDRLLKDFYSKPGHRFIHNAMNGVARGYIPEIFGNLGIPAESVFPMDSEKDDLLGLRFYANPEEQWLLPTMDRLKQVGAIFECANDTDGDRCGGILDETGFTNLNKLLAMLCDFTIRGLGWENHIVIRTGTTSTAIDDVVRALAGKYDIPTPEWDRVNSLVQHPFYHIKRIMDGSDTDLEYVLNLHKFPCIDTEVGFKYISAAMKKYDLPAAVAGEESGGFTIKRFPDKDGIIGICMIASMIAWHGKPPGEIWKEHTERYGEKHDVRLDIWAPNTPKENIINSWLDNPPESIAGQKVLWAGGTYHDKVEFVLQNLDTGTDTSTAVISRLLVRASGTEEINRIYIESSDKKILDALRQAALDRLNGLIVEDVGSAASHFDLADRVASTGMTFMTEPDRERYFDAVKRRMDALASEKGEEPAAVYRRVLHLLTLGMDRDVNVRHAAWGVDIGAEYYRRIFR